MSELFTFIAPVIALIGGIVLFMALFTPKRFTAKRPARFVLGWGLLALSAGMWFFSDQFAV